MKKQKLFIHNFCGHSITYTTIMAEPQEPREITKMFYKQNKYHLRKIKFLWKKFFHLLPYDSQFAVYYKAENWDCMRFQWTDAQWRTGNFLLLLSSNIRGRVTCRNQTFNKNPESPTVPRSFSLLEEITCSSLNIHILLQEHCLSVV